MGWISKLTGEQVSYDDSGNRTTISADGVTAERDPHFSDADMTALQSGDISDVEYRRRYNSRYFGR
ncbi:hypothetical protein ABT354_05525 [Streptomyces sp. NPDC000594]|uniref:hypothetical protein n=1 Tax=Streptomyces sp. NPDC000594 TaxID=3154261 RepID=UPI003319D838